MKKFPNLLAAAIFSVLLLFISQSSFSQAISFGAKGGISIPNLTSSGTSNPLNSGYKSGLGPDFALFGEYHISSLFSLELDVEYSAQGGKKEGKQALPNPFGQVPPYLYANFDAKAQINYLLVPLFGKFNFDLDANGTWSAYGEAGPFIGFLLSAKTITKGTSHVYGDEAETMQLTQSPIVFDTTTDIKDQLNSTNYGVAANIGIAYHSGQHTFFLEGGGNYGFQVIQKDKANGENRAGAAVVRLGYAYTLGAKAKPGAKGVKDPNRF